MKNANTVIIVAAIAVIILFTIGVGIGESLNNKFARIERVEEILDETARHCGYISLGVIDGTTISRKNGYMYDGPGIRAELFKRFGLEVPENYWTFELGEKEGIHLIRFVVYKGEQREPVTEQEVDRVYIYGVY